MISQISPIRLTTGIDAIFVFQGADSYKSFLLKGRSSALKPGKIHVKAERSMLYQASDRALSPYTEKTKKTQPPKRVKRYTRSGLWVRLSIFENHSGTIRSIDHEYTSRDIMTRYAGHSENISTQPPNVMKSQTGHKSGLPIRP